MKNSRYEEDDSTLNLIYNSLSHKRVRDSIERKILRHDPLMMERIEQANNPYDARANESGRVKIPSLFVYQALDIYLYELPRLTEKVAKRVDEDFDKLLKTPTLDIVVTGLLGELDEDTGHEFSGYLKKLETEFGDIFYALKTYSLIKEQLLANGRSDLKAGV